MTKIIGGGKVCFGVKELFVIYMIFFSRNSAELNAQIKVRKSEMSGKCKELLR